MTLDETIQEERLHIRVLRQNAEARYVDCKNLLAEMYKNKKNMTPEDFAQLVEIVKDAKGTDEWWMKKLEDEAQHLNQGFNPPFYYHIRKK